MVEAGPVSFVFLSFSIQIKSHFKLKKKIVSSFILLGLGKKRKNKFLADFMLNISRKWLKRRICQQEAAVFAISMILVKLRRRQELISFKSFFPDPSD
jgi:hypothetical protein